MLVDRAGDEHYVGPFEGEPLGERCTDATRSARDERAASPDEAAHAKNAGLVAPSGTLSSGTRISSIDGPTWAATGASASRSKP